MQLVNENIRIARKVSRVYGLDPDGTDDLFQEMMYQLWKSFPSFNGASRFSTWMYSVCLNTALTYRRMENAIRNNQERIEHHDFSEDGNDDEQREHLYSMIAALPPVNRAVVLLYLEDLSYDEIAAITGLTRSNVSVRLVRIRKELEEKAKTIK